MIKSLKVRNFESWLKAHLEFDTGMNVLVGLSDIGKSGLFRALRWALLNSPAGDAFVSDLKKAKGKSTNSIVDFTEDQFIERAKKGTVNTYNVNDLELKAFGQSLPDEVSKVSRMSEINVQRQIEQFFLLSQTPGKRGEFFNKIAKIDKIDTSTKYASAQIKKIDSTYKNAEAETVRIKEELKTYDYIDDLEDKINKLKTDETEHGVFIKKADTIHELNVKRNEILVELHDIKLIDIVKIETNVQSVQNNEIKRSALLTRSDKIERLIRQRDVICEELNTIGSTDIQEIDKKYKDVSGLIKKHTQKQSHLRQIKRLHENRCVILEGLKSAEKQLVSKSKEFKRLRPNICPLCKGVWDETK